jgi:endonuclease-3
MPSAFEKKHIANAAILIFKKEYPRAWATLNYKNNFELLISTILSAQCTDARVNATSPALFSKYPDAKSLAKARQADVEKLIYSTGFYRSKAKNIINTSKLIMQNFGGKVPDNMDGLTSLAGVARKTANIVLFHAFGKNEGIAVDTHCMRISRRLGLVSSRRNQGKIEKELMHLIEKKHWGMYTNWMVLHGRKYCLSRAPKCGICPLSRICPKIIEK